ALPALAAAAVALILVQPMMPGPRDPSAAQGDHVRLKGARPALAGYRKTPDGAERLGADATVAAGDVLQLAYNGAGLPFGVIFSVDGRGAVTLHQPGSASAGSELVPGGEVRLSQAYVLDDAPDHETFVLVASDHPLDVGAVLDAARGTAGEGPFVDSAGQAAVVVRYVAHKAVP
ncbi:MAG TPA: ActD protein, partial [Myxococcota bacterium]|nr:ActD protein [Myxococcota bacterium]